MEMLPHLRARRLILMFGLGVASVMMVGGVIARHDSGAEPAPSRVIHLSAKDFRFNGNNPTLTLRRGERVQIVVTNDDTQPVPHGLIIPGLDAKTPRKLDPGESISLTFTADTDGVYTYT
ncbi:MAG: hypothetical protein HYU36_12795 [Planctomycetes bacterium]|nr:hypothetical protein [Planctomycetota bacterium]